MSLSCSCDFDPSDYETWWEGHSKFKPLESKRRKRCCSCEELIEITSEVIEFYNYRRPKDDIEERIHGDEGVALASSFMCEDCGGLYLALDELGYGCLDISGSMRDYVAEYNQMREEL